MHTRTRMRLFDHLFKIVCLPCLIGWNDGCTESSVVQYEANMVNLITDLRKEFAAPDMRVSIPVSGFGGWGQSVSRRLGIIQAQFNAANATRHPQFVSPLPLTPLLLFFCFQNQTTKLYSYQIL